MGTLKRHIYETLCQHFLPAIAALLVLVAFGKGNLLVMTTPVTLWVFVGGMTYPAEKRLSRQQHRSLRERKIPAAKRTIFASWRLWLAPVLILLAGLQLWARIGSMNPTRDVSIEEAITEGEGLVRAGQLENAAAVFEGIVVPDHLPRRSAQKYHNLGIIYVKLKRSEKAYAAFLKAVEYDPQDVQAYSLLGRLALDKGEYGKAVEFYETALEVAPEKVELQSALAAAKANANKSSR